ncbi:hypothetical protein RHECNPAF_430087 [Rhizobium etli CNPAF512]|nr:hypothetical protein RHECNPAF_430087 [Rhizobium etli CNPAF512]
MNSETRSNPLLPHADAANTPVRTAVAGPSGPIIDMATLGPGTLADSVGTLLHYYMNPTET